MNNNNNEMKGNTPNACVMFTAAFLLLFYMVDTTHIVEKSVHICRSCKNISF